MLAFVYQNEETPNSSSINDRYETRREISATPRNTTSAILICCVRECCSRVEIGKTDGDTASKRCTNVVKFSPLYWCVTRAFCCCICPAVKAAGERFLLRCMNNSIPVHGQTRYFARFPARECFHFPYIGSRIIATRGQ